MSWRRAVFLVRPPPRANRIPAGRAIRLRVLRVRLGRDHASHTAAGDNWPVGIGECDEDGGPPLLAHRDPKEDGQVRHPPAWCQRRP